MQRCQIISLMLLVLPIIRTTYSIDLLPDLDSCGRHTNPKIVGGNKTAIDEFPWMALLEFKHNATTSYECGGTLINKRYILTAAHCITPHLVSVRLGEYNLQTNPDCLRSKLGEDCAPPVQHFEVEETMVNDGYVVNDFNNDIALVRLNKEVEYSDFIQPICLPLTPEENNKSYIGENLTVSGWGLTEKEIKSSIKLKVQVPVQDLGTCMTIYKSKKLDDRQICAGGLKGKDSCREDSGGPLMSHKKDKNNDLRFYLIGIVSFGRNPCGQDNVPAVYTKVAKFIQWITNKLKP